MHRSTSGTRRACAVGTTIALVGLTTGLGVFGVQAASADDLPTSTSTTAASAAPTSSATTAATPSTAATSPAAAPTDAPTGASAPTTTTTPSGAPTTAKTRAASAATDAVAAADGTTATASPAATPAAAAPTVTLTSTSAQVGQTITADPNGFTGTPVYAWTRGGQTVGNGASYIVKTADIGATLTVTVTDGTGATATAETTAVTQAPVFADGPTSEDAPEALTAQAGQPFSYTFAATGAPAPTYALTWFDQSEADPTGTPDEQLPEGLTFDASTGVLSGTTTDADDSPFDFAVTATSGGTTVTEYAELTVDPGAAYGVEVYAIGKKDFDSQSGNGTIWIIADDGSIETLTVSGDGQDVSEHDGGQPTVQQGGTLVVSGDVVDQYGNEVYDADDAPVVPTVTSNVASDVIATDPEEGDPDVVDVTFPHASTHTLTVAAGAIATSFPVTVTPVVATVASTGTTTAAAPTTGELAFTGSDTTRALPWALGLLMAGLGMTGLRIARRRTQR